MAVEAPNVSASLLSQTIDEKLSARNGTKAAKRFSSEISTLSGSITVTSLTGPHDVLVRLGVSPKARSMVNFTSFASNGVPSWHMMPSCSVKV